MSDGGRHTHRTSSAKVVCSTNQGTAHMVVEVEERASARVAQRPAESRVLANAVRNTVAIVLAGGRGARLKQLTDWRAKPAVAFGTFAGNCSSTTRSKRMRCSKVPATTLPR